MGATLDKFMTIEEVPEEWRSLDVTVGGPVDASNFCDNGVRTYKYNLLNFFPKSMSSRCGGPPINISCLYVL